MDGTDVESAFALLLTKVTKPPYPAKISYNRHNWRGTNYVPYLALLLEREVRSNDKKNNKWEKWKRFSGTQQTGI